MGKNKKHLRRRTKLLETMEHNKRCFTSLIIYSLELFILYSLDTTHRGILGTPWTRRRVYDQLLVILTRPDMAVHG